MKGRARLTQLLETSKTLTAFSQLTLDGSGTAGNSR
jgi:hypothetical protein